MRYLRTNTVTRITVGPFFDKTDGVTPETAITVTSEHLTFVVDSAGVPTLVLDTAPTASGGANDMVHITNDDAGFYDLELAAADVNYLGRAMLALTDATVHCPVFHEFMIVTAVEYDRMFATSGGNLPNTVAGANSGVPLSVDASGRVDVLKVNGTNQTARDLGASVLLDLTQTVAAVTGIPTTIGGMLYLIRQYVKNKLSYNKATDVMTLYEDDGTTAKMAHTMTDSATEATRGAGV